MILIKLITHTEKYLSKGLFSKCEKICAFVQSFKITFSYFPRKGLGAESWMCFLKLAVSRLTG